mmetsp:Transcript_17492/g.49187  ORF Transcript_17492/g.49187 Transcript_17492/m.49187 type:complete len:221 (-) Transcript_17492:2847-3509(-)
MHRASTLAVTFPDIKRTRSAYDRPSQPALLRSRVACSSISACGQTWDGFPVSLSQGTGASGAHRPSTCAQSGFSQNKVTGVRYGCLDIISTLQGSRCREPMMFAECSKTMVDVVSVRSSFSSVYFSGGNLKNREGMIYGLASLTEKESRNATDHASGPIRRDVCLLLWLRYPDFRISSSICPYSSSWKNDKHFRPLLMLLEFSLFPTTPTHKSTRDERYQ